MLKSIVCKCISFLVDRPLPAPTDQERALADELRNTFRGFPLVKATNKPESATEWVRIVNRLRELVLSRDPREFLRWDIIRSTMFVDNPFYVWKELKYLKNHPDWNLCWRGATQESHVGHPVPYLFRPRSSGNLIHHAYHLARFEEKTGKKIRDMKEILEFGGGYGSMCRLIHQLGFTGKYIIFDLPFLSALQSYYLRSTGIPLLPVEAFRTSNIGVTCIEDLHHLRALISHGFARCDSMFIATWSLSEPPIEVRYSIQPMLSRFESFLFAYRDQFFEMNNTDFFNEWREAQGDFVWHGWEIEHLPRNFYLVGAKVKFRE